MLSEVCAFVEHLILQLCFFKTLDQLKHRVVVALAAAIFCSTFLCLVIVLDCFEDFEDFDF
jgi:hypothetical protein